MPDNSYISPTDNVSLLIYGVRQSHSATSKTCFISEVQNTPYV